MTIIESAGADVQRDGDTWMVVWPVHEIGVGIDHIREVSDGLRAEITVESTAPTANGRLAGPVTINLLSARSQTETVTKIEKRANGTGVKLDWDKVVAYTCAIVAKQYRAPTPVIDLAAVETSAAVDYLIPGLIPEDETTVLYGDGESMKSLMALRIAYSVKTGEFLPWNKRVTHMCEVLYLDWETNPRTVAGRLQRISRGLTGHMPCIHYRQCFRSLSDELPNIREEISRKNIGFVVVDSIGFAASGALVEDETARASMNALRQMSPATRLVIAHVSNESARQTSGTARPFGSAFFWNGMRSGIEMRRSEDSLEDQAQLGMFHRKANDGEHHKPIGVNVIFDGRAGPIAFWDMSITDIPDLASRTSLSSRLRELLRKGAQETADLADRTDSPVDTVSRTLKRMPDVRQVRQGGGRGQPATWGLADDA